MKNSSFGVFILTNNRASNVRTVRALREQGYNGRIVLVLDDMDKSSSEYEVNYKDCEIYIFNKKEAMAFTDTADNTDNPNAVVYARNVCHRIAKELSLEYFLVLDDDYQYFEFRADDKYRYVTDKNPKNLNSIFDSHVDFLKSTPTKSIAFSQTGDFIGGVGGGLGSKVTLARKCMNSFFCKTDRPFQFYGLINEDVNCYTLNGSRGDLYFTNTHFSLKQCETQQNSGGLTTIYLELGTYVKSFYSVMYHPSSITVTGMGNSAMRLHHRVSKDLTYPKIIRESVKRGIK